MVTRQRRTIGFEQAPARRGLCLLFVVASQFVWASPLVAEAAATSPPAEFDCVMEPQQVVKLASPAIGVIARLDVDRGDIVRKNQVLGKLEDSVEAAALALARAKATNEYAIKSIGARLEFLHRKQGRADQLVARAVVAQATLDEAESDAKVAEQQMQEAQLNLGLARIEVQHAEAVLAQRTLLSPLDGVVVDRLLQPGEYRNDQSPVLTLAQIDPLRVEVFVPIRYFGQIRAGTEAKVRPEEPIGGINSATVTVVDRVLDAASGTFGVRLSLPNPTLALPAGIRCKIQFDLQERSR
jgi:RND family efflux transporter MFP subunit